MICYYCKDYDSEKNWCCLFDKCASDMDEDCDYFEFDTGLTEEDMEEIDEDDPYWGDDLHGSFYELSTEKQKERM